MLCLVLAGQFLRPSGECSWWTVGACDRVVVLGLLHPSRPPSPPQTLSLTVCPLTKTASPSNFVLTTVHIIVCFLYLHPPPPPPVGFYFSSEFCINLFVCNVVTLMSATLFVFCCCFLLLFWGGGCVCGFLFCFVLFCLCVCVCLKKKLRKVICWWCLQYAC